MRESPRRKRGPARRVVLIALCAVLGAVVVVLGLLVFDTSAIANHIKDRAVPGLAQKLGHELAVGPVRARILPRPHVEVSDVRVAGAPGEPDLLRAREADVTVELWPLLRSLGKDVRVSGVALHDTQLNLVKRRDSTWNYEDLERLTSGGDSGREYVVSELALRNVSVALYDAAHGARPTVTLERIDATARDLGADLPLSLDFSASLASNAPNLEGKLQLDRLPEKLSSGEYPKLTGTLTLKDASLDRLSALLPARLDALASGGRLSFDAALSTAPDGAYTVNGQARLEAVRLRGQPARGGFAFTATASPAHLDATTLRIDRLALQGPGVDLGGSAQLASAPVRVRFDLKGSRLDLDQVLGLMPASAEKAPAEASGPLVSPEVRDQLAGVAVAGTVALGEVHSGALTAHDLRADVALDRGVLTVRQGTAALYDGAVKLDGTRINLLAERPIWDLKANLERVDLGQALAQVTREKPMTGRATATLELHGDGNDWQQLRQRLTGRGTLNVQDGSLATDLGGKVAGALSQGLSLAGKGGLAEKVQSAQGTPLKDLAGSFTVKDGWLHLSRPLGFTAPFGSASVSGQVALDRRLDLTGHIALAPDLVRRASGGRITPEGPVDVPLQLAGTLADPSVRVPLAPADVARQLASSSAGKALEEKVRREVQGRFKGLIPRLPH